MNPLPGVRCSLDRMKQWARREGYHCEEFADTAGTAVESDRLHDDLTTLFGSLENELERVVVYFVGHGFLDYPDQIWILSEGPSVNAGRVSRNAFRSSIETYRPKQIAMISDSCLLPMNFASGSVPILRDRRGPRTRRVYVDNIYSTLPNKPSYFFSGDATRTEFCLFTSVLVDFLDGHDERAFRLARGVKSPHVTTQTLSFNLPDAVSERAVDLGVDQQPRVDMGFPFGDDVYSRFGGELPTSQPPDGDVERPGDVNPPADAGLLVGLDNESRPPNVPEGVAGAIVAAKIRGEGDDLTALVIPLGQRREFTYAFGAPAEAAQMEDCTLIRYRRTGRPHEPLLYLRWPLAGEDHFSFAPTYDHLLATVYLSSEEDVRFPHVSWARIGSLYEYEPTPIMVGAWRALRALERGTLRSSSAPYLADAMRDEKHDNPLTGIISAYLYDLVGDSDNLARLCYFYAERGQGIPFDIALLSGGTLERAGFGWEVTFRATPDDKNRQRRQQPWYAWGNTPEGRFRVAGTTPLLRIGWRHLSAQPDRTLRAFSRLADSLSASSIATLIGHRAGVRARQLLRDVQLL